MVNDIAPDVPVQSTPRVCSAKVPNVDHDSAWAGNETMSAYCLQSFGYSSQRSFTWSMVRASCAGPDWGGPASAATFKGSTAKAKSSTGNDVCMEGSWMWMRCRTPRPAPRRPHMCKCAAARPLLPGQRTCVRKWDSRAQRGTAGAPGHHPARSACPFSAVGRVTVTTSPAGPMLRILATLLLSSIALVHAGLARAQSCGDTITRDITLTADLHCNTGWVALY